MTELRVMDLLAKKEVCKDLVYIGGNTFFPCQKEEGHSGRHIHTREANNLAGYDDEITIIWGKDNDPVDGYVPPF